MVVRVPMSKTGHTRLRAELIQLERHDRIDIIGAIEVARAHGDLKENAEYRQDFFSAIAGDKHLQMANCYQWHN